MAWHDVWVATSQAQGASGFLWEAGVETVTETLSGAIELALEPYIYGGGEKWAALAVEAAVEEWTLGTVAQIDACCREASRDRQQIAQLSEHNALLRHGLMQALTLADRHRSGNNACKLIADSIRAHLTGRVRASADTHPKGGDVEQAPSLMSGAVDAEGSETPKGNVPSPGSSDDV